MKEGNVLDRPLESVPCLVWMWSVLWAARQVGLMSESEGDRGSVGGISCTSEDQWVVV